MGAFPLVTVLVLALVPVGAGGGVLAWSRWLRRRGTVPGWVVGVGYALGALAAVFGLLGPVEAWRASARTHADEPDVSDKARRLAEAVSATMNCGGLGVLLALAGGAWLALWTWRAHPPVRKKLLLLGALVATPFAGCAMVERLFSGPRDRPVLEAFQMVQNIRSAQEAHRAKTGTYANVSRALAANQSTSHFALYPQEPREPGVEPVAWGGGCSEAACADGDGWSLLAVHVPFEKGVRFGYSTIAGRAGERPTAKVSVNGAPLEWPTPKEDWYLISAVGDPLGKGTFTTIVAASWATETWVDHPEMTFTRE